MFKSENERTFRWLTTVVLAVIILLSQFGYDNFGSDVRFFNDYYDRSDYAHIGARVLTGEIPYVGGVTEYPQVPVYLFRGLTWLASHLLPSGWPAEVGFLIFWLLFISLITLLSVWQLWRMLPEGKRSFAWLMFLPAAIYFSINRFDILPMYLSLLAITAIKKERFAGAAALLAAGALTKWYLVLLLPFFLGYELRCTRKSPWRSIMVFGCVCASILLPTFILGGWQAVWQPYAWHLNRLVEPGTFLWLAGTYLGEGGKASATLTSLFTLLGFSGVSLVILKGLKSVNRVILSSIATLLIFIFFTRIFSPQWWLWILPLMILTIENKFDLILVVLYDLLNYLAFPITYDLLGNKSPFYLLITGLLLTLIVILFIRTIMKLMSTERQAPA
jgi:hypothetical protein